ncbi:MAG: sensor histidine kinase [Geminicoccaceae bacterium]
MNTTIRVLVIDDSEDDRDICKRFLENDANVEVVDLAEDGEQGLVRYQECRADCVLLDFNLPGHDGLSVLERLKSIDPHAAVVMMTGEGNQDIAVAAMKAGAFDYVVKGTITAPVLRRALDNAIQKASLVREIDVQREEQATFIRVLVHDIRAPLRGLMGFTEILGEDLEEGVYDDIPNHLEMIKTAAERMDALVDTLAHYAILDGDIAFASVSMNDIAKQVLGNLKMTIEERRATVDIAPLPDVTGHEPQLVQLFQNLIGNGIKYNEQPMPAIKVAAEQHGEDWLFTIEDNGIGIPEDMRQKVFEPFQRLWSQDTYEGTGLGLAICRKIVERHGGRIWCESQDGEGSRFFFTMSPG